jgi:hypothetical protein
MDVHRHRHLDRYVYGVHHLQVALCRKKTESNYRSLLYSDQQQYRALIIHQSDRTIVYSVTFMTYQKMTIFFSLLFMAILYPVECITVPLNIFYQKHTGPSTYSNH